MPTEGWERDDTRWVGIYGLARSDACALMRCLSLGPQASHPPSFPEHQCQFLEIMSIIWCDQCHIVSSSPDGAVVLRMQKRIKEKKTRKERKKKGRPRPDVSKTLQA